MKKKKNLLFVDFFFKFLYTYKLFKKFFHDFSFSLDPPWASINRGILLCSECCSVHRSLGRHISQIKSLRQGTWSPSVLNFVNSLNAHGANSVWEHCLLDTTSGSSSGSITSSSSNKQQIKRKPNPKDPLHPNKSDFIKAKHVNLAFVLKPSLQNDDDSNNLEIELSKQLHASVRTSNLETSLRLIVQGADPNYFHEVKRNLRKDTYFYLS